MFGSSEDEADEEETFETQSDDGSFKEDKFADPIDLDGHNYPQWVKNVLGCRLQVRLNVLFTCTHNFSPRSVSPTRISSICHVPAINQAQLTCRK